jgi:hypothetical protein
MTTVTEEAGVKDCTELIWTTVLATLPAVVLVAGSCKFLCIQVVAEAFASAFYIFHIVDLNLPAGLD